MDTWESISALRDFEEYRFIKAPVPVYDQAAYDLAFQRCRENKCGTFDTNWGCNPGAKRDVAEYYKGIDYVVIMTRRFEIDYHDSELLASVTEDMQRGCRRFVLKMRDMRRLRRIPRRALSVLRQMCVSRTMQVPGHDHAIGIHPGDRPGQILRDDRRTV
ncbi:MAG: hypothetical protein IKN41_06110, partial [Candidatus Methanomethylophilaceae archaeon]|nr:hypothetical protein [Candidatus Methanomethylophilaceae archaeon]